MSLNLYDYQYEASRSSNGLTYLKPKITTNQKRTIESQKLKRRELKLNTKENHQMVNRKTKRKRKEQEEIQNELKARHKTAINTYLSIINKCQWNE